MIYPCLRVCRMTAGVFIYPSNPVAAIAVSEIASFIIPILNPSLWKKVITSITIFMYSPTAFPEFINMYIQYGIQEREKYEYAELCSILLFILMFELYKFQY